MKINKLLNTTKLMNLTSIILSENSQAKANIYCMITVQFHLYKVLKHWEDLLKRSQNHCDLHQKGEGRSWEVGPGLDCNLFLGLCRNYVFTL